MDSRETLKTLREDTGMNRRQFAEYFGIPYRTIQDWELGNRRMPEYLLRLMMYKAEKEKMLEEAQVQEEIQDQVEAPIQEEQKQNQNEED